MTTSGQQISQSLGSFRWQAATIAFLVAIGYANSLGSSFHFDDYGLFTNPSIMSPGFGWDLFRLQQTRPLTFLTFHWNVLLDGPNPLLFHWTNLLLHAANSILLLALARRYFSPRVAWCAAMIFALHPLQTESVTYVFARSTLLSTHFALWTLWFYARGQYLGSVLMFGISMLAKEEPIALPGFLLLLALFERRRPGAGYFAALFSLAGVAAGRLFYLILVSPSDPGVGRVRGISTAHYLLTQCRVLWIYMRLMIAPIGLNLDRDVAASTGLLAPWTTLAAALSLLALLAALIWLLRRRRPAAMWALGFFVLLAPSSSFVAQADMIYEHRTYLPMVCAVMALGFLLAGIGRTKLALAFAMLIPLMLAGTIARNRDWHDEKTFWTDVAAKSPNKGRSWLGLARAYADNPDKAREYTLEGLRVAPENAELHTHRGIALMGAGQPADALAHFERALALTEATADRLNNIGAAYFGMGELDRAAQTFELALTRDLCNYNARRNLIVLYTNLQNSEAADKAAQVPEACRMLPQQAREFELWRRHRPDRRTNH